ncbi:alpha/beta fold hydrolase [Thalassiella azotivora]
MTDAARTGVVSSGQARLWFDDTGGDGPALVLVHAGIADARMWDPLVDLLRPDHRVVRCDLRGYGRSALPSGPFSHIDDLRAVVRDVVDGPAHLVGASYGGRVAVDLALADPDLVRSLTLLGTALSGFEPDVAPPPLWDEMVAAHRADDVDALADLEARTWLADPDRSRVPDLVALVREMNRTALVNERSGVAEEVEPEPPAVDVLEQVAVPTLVAVGDLDQPDILLAADEVARRVPGARRVDLPGVAHLPALEVPDRVAELVREHVRAAVAATP